MCDARVAPVCGVCSNRTPKVARAAELALPFPIRFCDAPLVEGAAPALATATAGGDLAAVAEAAEEAYRVRKTPPHHPPHLLGN